MGGDRGPGRINYAALTKQPLCNNLFSVELPVQPPVEIFDLRNLLYQADELQFFAMIPRAGT